MIAQLRGRVTAIGTITLWVGLLLHGGSTPVRIVTVSHVSVHWHNRTVVEQIPSSESFTTAQVGSILTQVAAQDGLNRCLVWATAWRESEWNPFAVGDLGSSYGVFQLHVGGELGSLAPSTVLEPAANALVAGEQLAHWAHIYPDGNPGDVAALAQRPADPSAYAAVVNYWFAKCENGWQPPATTYVGGIS
ncbi:MAG: hypothetical protein ACYDHP_00675 [Ferrimicrobium sp.]